MTKPTLRLLDWARAHDPDVLAALDRAVVFTQQAHRGQMRLSGDTVTPAPCGETRRTLALSGAPVGTIVIQAVPCDSDERVCP